MCGNCRFATPDLIVACSVRMPVVAGSDATAMPTRRDGELDGWARRPRGASGILINSSFAHA
eukprot:6211744-Pleurochrysis_carterae.AAC.5